MYCYTNVQFPFQAIAVCLTVCLLSHAVVGDFQVAGTRVSQRPKLNQRFDHSLPSTMVIGSLIGVGVDD